MTTHETILMRIKKLLNLTEARGATPEEAANAAAKAQALLFEHNLSMAAVEGVNLDKAESYDKTDYEMKEGKGQYEWRKSLLAVIARENFCKVIQFAGVQNHVDIIGKRSNVEVVCYIYESVQREIERLARIAKRQQAVEACKYYSSFCRGAIFTIAERLRAQRRTNEQATSSSTALVVQTDADLKRAVSQWFPSLRPVRSAPVRRSDGYAAGKHAGHSISLNRGVGHTGSTPRRLS